MCSTTTTEIPSCVGELTGLKELDLIYCSSLVNLPESMGQLTALECLSLFACSLVMLLESMGQLIALESSTYIKVGNELLDCDYTLVFKSYNGKPIIAIWSFGAESLSIFP